MEVLVNLEYYFVLCATYQCFFQSMYVYLFVLHRIQFQINPLRKIIKTLKTCLKHVVEITSFLMCFLSFVMFVVYMSKLLNYLSHYLPLSLMYLLYTVQVPFDQI